MGEGPKTRVKLVTRDARVPQFRHAPYIGGFVLAYGRQALNKYMDLAGRERCCYRYVQTDGFLVCGGRAPALAKHVTPELGNLSVEAQGSATIWTLNRYRIEGPDGVVVKQAGGRPKQA